MLISKRAVRARIHEMGKKIGNEQLLMIDQRVDALLKAIVHPMPSKCKRVLAEDVSAIGFRYVGQE